MSKIAKKKKIKKKKIIKIKSFKLGKKPKQLLVKNITRTPISKERGKQIYRYNYTLINVQDPKVKLKHWRYSSNLINAKKGIKKLWKL